MGSLRDFYGVQRRREKDPLVVALNLTGAAGWLALLASVLYIGKAKPEFARVFGFKFATTVRVNWDQASIDKSFTWLVVALVLGLISLLLNSARLRRKDDFFRVSPILLTASSVVGLFLWFYNFG